jgi:hypothetical protein
LANPSAKQKSPSLIPGSKEDIMSHQFKPLHALIAPIFIFGMLFLTDASVISQANAQVVITEVDYHTNQIEIVNIGDVTVDISNWQLCSRFAYRRISALTIEPNDANLAPGGIIVVSGFALDDASADLGLYNSGSFGSPAAMESFVQWGAGGIGREGVAVQKGIWKAGEFVESVANGHSIEYDGVGVSAEAWTDQPTPTFGEFTLPSVELEVVGSDSLSTSAPIAGVTYELAVTNGTNQQGTVNLVPFPELGIEGTVLGTLSSSSFDLAPGQSATVLLKVTGDAFTEAGTYEVTVTATLRETSAEVKTTTTVTIPKTFGVALVVEGKDDSTIEDVVAGAPYTLIVTNTGNQPDTITLEADPSVGIEGTMGGTVNPTSVELEPGTAETITLNVIGDAATQAGTYDVKVIATSTGDSTQTAEAVTHTTVDLPVVDETPWDVNKDGTVNIFDLVIVSGDFGKTEPGLQGDVDGNGTVNIFDLVLVARHFGEDTSVPAAAPAAR